MLATKLRKTGKFNSPKHSGPVHLRPKNLNQLRLFLEPESGTPLPIRPQGAGTAATDCNTTSAGSILQMTQLDRVFLVDRETIIPSLLKPVFVLRLSSKHSLKTAWN